MDECGILEQFENLLNHGEYTHLVEDSTYSLFQTVNLVKGVDMGLVTGEGKCKLQSKGERD